MRPRQSCTLFLLLFAIGATSGAAAPAAEDPAVVRFRDDVLWLADDAREGRGIGTRGLAEARDWIVARFQALGVQPAGEAGSWFQTFRVPTSVEVASGTGVAIDGRRLDRQAYQPAGFSSSARVEAAVVAAGYGITAPDLAVDDYAGLDVKGKIVAVRRFTPKSGPFEQEDHQRRHGDLRAKAWNAREHGAVGLIVVDAPPPGVAPEVENAGEAPLPEPAIESGAGAAVGDAGIPVVLVSRAAGAPLFTGRHRAGLAVELTRKSEPAQNVVGVIRAGASDRLPGAVLVGAHYDHIGLGDQSSLSPGSREVHNGADDNASGVAALIEVARRLAERRSELRRDVWLVAFAAEELGTLGSTTMTRQPPAGLRLENLVGMLNMDMVGRLRDLG
ncbi:MAG TPA: M20/M25/M40 family metallo-hydrolase, partial [Thermoanaerobaculia bacterium]|nr:M20/M25/M40 family metallo-hydrolase [Thermoanaerobaculia bacterium]